VDVVLEEKALSREMAIMAEEAMLSHMRAEQLGNAARARMALAKVAMCHQMMVYMLEFDDWSWFDEKLEEVLELQDSLYRKARAENDRDMSLITLARIRLLKTLARRLADPVRHHAIAHDIQESRPASRVLH
jgi:hypothetical protein